MNLGFNFLKINNFLFILKGKLGEAENKCVCKESCHFWGLNVVTYF